MTRSCKNSDQKPNLFKNDRWKSCRVLKVLPVWIGLRGYYKHFLWSWYQGHAVFSTRAHLVEAWNHNTRNNISFSVSKITFIYLMAPIDFNNDKNTMRGVIWGYIYSLNIKICINDNTRKVIIFTIIQDTFAELGELRLEFIKKRMYSLVNDENYYRM